MNFLLESKNHYKLGDIILIEYWYSDFITPVKVIGIVGKRYKVSHKIDESEIFNAPDEIIKTKDIIDKYKS